MNFLSTVDEKENVISQKYAGFGDSTARIQDESCSVFS